MDRGLNTRMLGDIFLPQHISHTPCFSEIAKASISVLVQSKSVHKYDTDNIQACSSYIHSLCIDMIPPLLTINCPKHAVPLEDCQREYGRVTRSPLHKVPGIQGRRRSDPPVQRKDLGSLWEADKATGAVSSTLLALHPWHKIARPRVKRRSLQKSQPAQHRVHLASGATVLG